MCTARNLRLDLADYVASTQCDKIPDDAIDAAKKSILDLVGVILAASGVEPAVRGVLELVDESGGPPESTVLGAAKRAPAI